MASLGMPLSMDYNKPGPTVLNIYGECPSKLGVDPALEWLDAPHGSGLPNLASWTEDFLASGKGMPDDEFVQFYDVYAKLNPNRARVPPEYLEEFKTRAGASPAIWQIEEARACAPEARDVVPPAPAPSPPPPGSQPEPGDSTAEVRARRRRTLTMALTFTLTLTLAPDPQPGDQRPRRPARPARLAAALAAARATGRQRLQRQRGGRGSGSRRTKRFVGPVEKWCDDSTGTQSPAG